MHPALLPGGELFGEAPKRRKKRPPGEVDPFPDEDSSLAEDAMNVEPLYTANQWGEGQRPAFGEPTGGYRAGGARRTRPYL